MDQANISPRCVPLQSMVEGCRAALGSYPTSIDEDLALLGAGGGLEPGSRRHTAVRVGRGLAPALTFGREL